MSPPERTFGPIGWKGLFGDDESSDEESTSEEESAGADRQESSGERAPTGADRRGGDAGDDTARRSGTGEAIRDERARRARALSDDDEGADVEEDPLDDWTTLEEMSSGDREVRSDVPPESAGERGTPGTSAPDGEHRGGPSATEDDAGGVAPEWAGASSGADDDGEGADSAASEDAGIRDRIDAFYARYFLPPSVTGDDLGDEEPADADTGDGSGTVAATSSGSTAGSAGTSSTGSAGAADQTADTDSTAERKTETGSGSRDEAGAAAGAGAAGGTGREPARTTDRDRRGSRDEVAGENAEPPRSEPRVRTSRSGTEPEPDPSSTSERTMGPIGLKWLSDEEDGSDESAARAEETRAGGAAASTTAAVERSTGTVDRDRRRTPAREESATDDEGLTSRVPWSISFTAIGVGVGLLVFIDIVSMMVPLIAAIGAGIVGGFVAGYISGGTVRGGMHALAVGIIGGISVGYLTALVGALIGLFLEPATLLGRLVGPITPDLGMFGAWGPLLVMVLVAAMVAIDATLAGVVGGTLRSMVDEAR